MVSYIAIDRRYYQYFGPAGVGVYELEIKLFQWVEDRRS
jgi:hypothetical protein